LTKQILFRSALDRPEELALLKPGTYEAAVLAWGANPDRPISTARFAFTLSQADADQLESQRSTGGVGTVRIATSKWEPWQAKWLDDAQQRRVLRMRS
jgi:hypothetical protein